MGGSPVSTQLLAPEGRDATSAKATIDLQQEILSAFRGDVEPVSVSPAYRLGILLVAIVMVILREAK